MASVPPSSRVLPRQHHLAVVADNANFIVPSDLLFNDEQEIHPFTLSP